MLDNMYLAMFVGAVFGIVLQALIKINGINNRLPNETYVSVFKVYIKEDLFSLMISFVATFAVIFVSSEWLDKEVMGYAVKNFIKTFSIPFGYSANSVVGAFFGKTEKILRDKFQ